MEKIHTKPPEICGLKSMKSIHYLKQSWMCPFSDLSLKVRCAKSSHTLKDEWDLTCMLHWLRRCLKPQRFCFRISTMSNNFLPKWSQNFHAFLPCQPPSLFSSNKNPDSLLSQCHRIIAGGSRGLPSRGGTPSRRGCRTPTGRRAARRSRSTPRAAQPTPRCAPA